MPASLLWPRGGLTLALCVLLPAISGLAGCGERVTENPGNGAPPPARPLAVDPGNSHYFTGMDGRPLLFLSHADNSVALEGMTDTEWRWQIDQSAANGLNLVKLQGFFSSDVDDPAKNQIQPWLRTAGAGRTVFGHGRWDLDRFNDAFFRLLNDVCTYAQARGVYVQVQIWNHINLKPGRHYYRWDGCAFNPQNTTTDTAAYGFAGPGHDGSATFYRSLQNHAVAGGKTLLQRQEELFDRIVDATERHPNVFYELGLEVSPGTDWARHWVDRLHHVAPGKLMIVDVSHYAGDASFFDGVTRHQVGDDVPRRLYASGKLAIQDTDFIDDWAKNDLARARRAAWRAVLGGDQWTDFRINPNVFVRHDGRVDWKYPGVVRQLKYLRQFLIEAQVPFDRMHPVDRPDVTELAGEGVHAVYTDGRPFKLALPHAPSLTRWYDPRTGTFEPVQTASGGIQSFTPPTATDWVLFVRPKS
jgi:hypothetical protein